MSFDRLKGSRGGYGGAGRVWTRGFDTGKAGCLSRSRMPCCSTYMHPPSVAASKSRSPDDSWPDKFRKHSDWIRRAAAVSSSVRHTLMGNIHDTASSMDRTVKVENSGNRQRSWRKKQRVTLSYHRCRYRCVRVWLSLASVIPPCSLSQRRRKRCA